MTFSFRINFLSGEVFLFLFKWLFSFIYEMFVVMDSQMVLYVGYFEKMLDSVLEESFFI